MAVVWDQALYDAAYESGPPGNQRHFERSVLFPVFERRAAALVSLLSLDATHRVVIFGCGFDWTGEALRALGIDAVGTDTSPYIQSDWNLDGETTSDKKPLNEDGLGNGSRQQIRKEFAGNNDPTHVISEDILFSLTDAEITELAQWDSFTGATIAHIVTPLIPKYATQQQGEFPAWNWKSIEGWRTFLDGLGLSHHLLFHVGEVS